MDFVSLIFYFAAAASAVVAVIGSLRDRQAPARRTFCFALLLLGIQSALAGIAYNSPESEAAFRRSWWLLPQALAPGAWLFFILKYSRGNFQKSFKKWLPLVIALTGIPLASVTLIPETVIIPAPGTSLTEGFHIGLGGFILYLCVVLASALILINAERTFRAAVGTMRWRIKYVILGTVVLFTGTLYTASQVLLFQVYSFSFDIINSIALLVASALFLFGLLRTGLFRVQVYPSEQVLQFSVAGILIGAYLILIGVFTRVFFEWRGPEAFAIKAFLLLTSLTLVGILLVSERTRDNLRRWISRHFHRPFFNYRTVWLSLTEKTATVLDVDLLCRSVAEWISEHLRVLSTSVWLVDTESHSIRLAASTGLSSSSEPVSVSDTAAVIAGLEKEPAPFDIDKRKEDWVRHLDPCFPDHFPDAGNRVCVPLTSAGQLIGFCTLGDRVNYIPLELQEFELLKCVADQVASSILSLQLSSRIIQAREMEAFQTIAAFFVHDLKNTASTLNLTLQNLPKHFDNPEFRKDALKAIGKSVDHIQELISRLTLFRNKVELNCAPVDLNALVTSCLESLKSRQMPVSTNLLQIDPILADADQLRKVLTNLVLNAADSLGQNGRIEIRTAQENGFGVLSVTDNGSGMSPEFVSRLLFRPFQTTKKGGIGIGMFQSKAIVSAHRGRIEVRSELGKGTEFRVAIPSIRPWHEAAPEV